MDEEEYQCRPCGPKRRMFLEIKTPDGVITRREVEQQSCLLHVCTKEELEQKIGEGTATRQDIWDYILWAPDPFNTMFNLPKKISHFKIIKMFKRHRISRRKKKSISNNINNHG